MDKKIHLISIVFLLATCIPLIAPLFHYGFPPTHDGEYHIIRAWQFDKALRDGDWYPRWQKDVNNGYGSPLLNYYYPLPYYAMSLFHFLGLSFINSFKISIIAATLLGAVFFFLWVRIFWGDKGGFVSAVFYTYSPYHIVDIYVRGSIGELWSLAFFPGFLWAVTKMIKEKNMRFVVLGALFLALIVFSHNILAAMFFPFAITYCLVLVILSGNWKRFVVPLLRVVILGIGASAIFWAPALLERQYVRGLLIYNVSEHFPEMHQLLFPSWGSGFSNTDASSQMSFQIGVPNLLVVFISILVVIFMLRNKNTYNAFITAFFLVMFLVIFFLMLSISLPLWRVIPLFNFFQFPWRFLSLEILVASVLAGGILTIWNSKTLAGLMITGAVLLVIQYVSPAYYWEREDSYYFTRSNFVDGTNTPGNIFNTVWFQEGLKRQNEKIIILEGQGKISNIFVKSTKYAFVTNSDSSLLIGVNTAYFPGWTALVNGKSKEVKKTRNGLFAFNVPKGKNSVIVELRNTSIRDRANSISLLSALILLTVSVYARIKR